MVFRVPEVAGRHRPKLARNLNIDAGRLLQAAALHQTHGRIDNGFRGEPMSCSGFKPEDVTRQMECADLTPSVGKQLVAASRT